MSSASNPVYLIQHLAGVLGKQSETVLQENLGLGLSQFRILLALEWNPRASQRNIASSLGQTEASVSRQIKTMAGKGLLVSKPAPANRRRQIIVPTPFGMKLTEAANDILRRNLDSELSKHLTTDQTAQLVSGLQKLHAAVCRPGRPGACDHQLRA